MPYGEHLARCLHCGHTWIVGDCVPSICPDCETKGHNCRYPLAECGACKAEDMARRAERVKLTRDSITGYQEPT